MVNFSTTTKRKKKLKNSITFEDPQIKMGEKNKQIYIYIYICNLYIYIYIL